MKKLQALLAIAVSGALLNVGVSTFAQPSKPGYATVIRVAGAASYSLDGGDRRFPLVAGKYLEPGAIIYTGADGVVDVVLGRAIQVPQASWTPQRISLSVDSPVRGLTTYRPDSEQNVVRLMANSILSLDKLTTTSSGADTVSDTELDLKKGGIYASVKKLSPAAQYLVKTPTGIAGVRGTEFTLVLNDDGTIKECAVYQTHNDDGLVLAVTSAGGATQTFIIEQGQVWEPGDAAPVPITPELRRLFGQIFPMIRTHFFQEVNFDYDRTTYRESSDFGF